MSEQYWGCSDKMSEANFSPAETLSIAEKFQKMTDFPGIKIVVTLVLVKVSSKSKLFCAAFHKLH